MSTASTHLAIDGAVASFTFTRPEARNALTWEMYDALVAACERVDADHDIRVLVIKGETSEEYIAGLRAARGETEQPALPPPQRQLASVPIEPDLEGVIPSSPDGRAPGHVLGNGSAQQVGFTDSEVGEPS